jgi:hypothetical protein
MSTRESCPTKIFLANPEMNRDGRIGVPLTRALESAEGEVGRKTDRSLPRNVQARGAPCSPELWAVR